MKTIVTAGLIALSLAACAHDVTHSAFSMDLHEGHTRRITHMADGVTRTLSMDGAVTFVDGAIASMGPGVTVVFEQDGDGPARRGEVRWEDGAPVVYVDDRGTLRPAADDEREWFATFLARVGADDSPDDDERLRELAHDPAAPVADVIAQVHTLSFDSEQTAVLTALLEREALSADEQLAIVDAAWGLSFGSSRAEVVRGVIARDDFTPQARTAILDGNHRLPFDSDRADVLEALLRRDG